MKTNGESLRLNTVEKRFLGVCAGVASYLDLPAVAVRLIYAIACVIWPTLIIVYFIMYWVLKTDHRPGKIKAMVAESRTVNHFRHLDYRRPLYRNQHDSRIAGVCSGFADYFDISPFIIRLVTFLSIFFFGPFTFTAYIVCWMAMSKRPEGFSYEKHDELKQQAESHKDQPVHSIQECGVLLSSAESRLREVEAFMTSKKFSLHCEINRI